MISLNVLILGDTFSPFNDPVDDRSSYTVFSNKIIDHIFWQITFPLTFLPMFVISHRFFSDNVSSIIFSRMLLAPLTTSLV